MFDAEDEHRRRLNEAAERLRKSESACDALGQQQLAMDDLKTKLKELQKKLNAKVLQLNQKQGEVRSLRDELDAERARSQHAEEALTGMQARSQRLEAEVESLQQSNNDSESTMRRLRDSLAERIQTAQHLKNMGEEASRALMKVQGEKTLTDARLKDERARNLALEKELKIIVEAHDARVDGLERDLQLAQDELSLLRQEHATSVSTHAMLLDRADKASESAKQESSKNEKNREDLHAAQLELETLKRTLRELQSNLHKANLQSRTRSEAGERAEQRVAILTSELEKERKRAQHSREEVLALTTRLAQTEGSIKATESEKNALEKKLQTIRHETELEEQRAAAERKHSEELMTKLTGLQREKALMSEDSISAKATVRRLQEEVESLTKDVKRLQKLLHEQETVRSEVEERLQEKDMIAQNLARKVETLRNESKSSDAKWKDERSQTMRLLDHANSKLTQLQMESNRLQRENQGLTVQVKETKAAAVAAEAEAAEAARGISLFSSRKQVAMYDSNDSSDSSSDEDVSDYPREDVRLAALTAKSSAGRTPMMRNYELKQTKQALRQGVLFRPCNDAAFAAFMEVCTMMTFKSGSPIIRQGEIGSLLFVIVQGEVRIWRRVRQSMDAIGGLSSLLDTSISEEGEEPLNRVSNYKEQELIRRSVDQFFGEFALVTKHAPRTANVTAVTFVKLAALTKDDYEKLNSAHNNVFETIFAPHKRDGSAARHVPKGRSSAVRHLRKRSVITAPMALRLLPQRSGMDRAST
jgi:CRP-like cAMP-binding protein